MATQTQTPDDTVQTNPTKGETDAIGRPYSTVLADAPALSRKGLTRLLILMCVVPIATVLILQLTMPPVNPGSLKADCRLVNVPPAKYYETRLEDRISFPTAAIVVKNTGEESWTHLNIRINSGHYQIYEHGSPLEPGQERTYLLNRFVHRSGAVFDVGINRPYSVEIYARLPNQSRGTYERDLD
ncbi:MAG: hypothetical protein ACR2NP_08215 [Pirellulaceae bacterium]